MLSKDPCLNITFFFILFMLIYIMFTNRPERFAVDQSNSKPNVPAVNDDHQNPKPIVPPVNDDHKNPKPIDPPGHDNYNDHDELGPTDILAEHIISTRGIVSRGEMPLMLGNRKKNQYLFHTPQNGKKELWISPRKVDDSDWDWDNSLSIDSTNHVVSTNGNQLQLANNFMLSADADGWLRTRSHDGKGYKDFAAQHIWADQGVKSQGCDFVLGQNCANGNSGASRALVKDAGPQLVVNYANDFSGGTRVDGDLHISKLWIGDRWSLEPEGDVLVFRDNKSNGNNHYTMLPGHGVKNF